MILFEAVKEFFEYCAEQSSFIQHTPGAEDSTNRFAAYKTESVIAQNSSLGYPRLEIIAQPFGNLTENYSHQDDNMTIRVRVVQQLADKKDFTEEMTAQDNCKKALMQMVNYIKEQQEANTTTELMCAFNIGTVKYQYLDNAAIGGSAAGCEMTVIFRRCVDWEIAGWGELPPFDDTEEGSLAIFLNGHWTALEPGRDGQILKITDGVPTWANSSAENGVGKPVWFIATIALYSYTATQVPRLADIVGNEILRITVDGSYIMPENYSWDETTLSFTNITFSGTEKIIIEHQNEPA